MKSNKKRTFVSGKMPVRMLFLLRENSQSVFLTTCCQAFTNDYGKRRNIPIYKCKIKCKEQITKSRGDVMAVRLNLFSNTEQDTKKVSTVEELPQYMLKCIYDNNVAEESEEAKQEKMAKIKRKLEAGNRYLLCILLRIGK